MDKQLTDDFINKLVSDLKQKQEKFMAKSYAVDSDEYSLILHLVDQFVKNNPIVLYLEDVQCSNWEYLVPQEWQKRALKETGDKKKSLSRYIDAMHSLGDLFNHLCYFTEDIDQSFPSSRIIIRTPVIDNKQYLIDMNLVVGQGSDFILSIVEANPEKYEDYPIKFILDWDDAIKVAKMNKYDQAEWYTDNCLYTINRDANNSFTRVSLITEENRDKVLSIILAGTKDCGYFYDIINSENFNKKMGIF
jgi:hypothetical protein